MRSRAIVSLAALLGLFAPATRALAADPVEGLQVTAVRTLPYHPGVVRDDLRIPSAVEIRRFSLNGLPVRGAFETRWVTRGVARTVASRTPSHAPVLRPEDATLGPQELAERVYAIAGVRPTRSEVPELVYVDVLGHPVLAWEVELPMTGGPGDPNAQGLTQRTLWVGASSGLLVEERENIFSARAHVYPENPVSTPEPVEVELPGLSEEGPGVPLSGNRIKAMGCSLTWPAPEDVPEEVWWEEEDGRCYPVQTVFTDGSGDFTVEPPDVRLREVHVDGDEGYAELSMYFHAEKFLGVMEAMGVEGFVCDQATMLANYRLIEPSPSTPELDYGPFNNAYFTGRCESGPTMMFGQGSTIDFGFDGDVVYHELGHGIVSMLTPDGLGDYQLTDEGNLKDARGANEAYADYLSAMVSEDPHLADYVGTYGNYSRPYIRTAENTRTCPQNIRGQEHNDSESLMAALWATRTRVGSALDDAVVLSLTRLAPDASLTEVATAIVQVAEDMGPDALGPDGLDFLVRNLEARGLLNCPRVITDPEATQSGRSVYLRRKIDSVEPFFPGPVQLRHVVPEGSDNVVVRYTIGGSGNPQAELLLKRADEPIEFTYEFAVIESPGDDGEPVVAEMTLVGGDWDLHRAATELTGNTRQVVVRGLLPGEVVHLTLVTRSTNEAVASGFHVVSVPRDELDEGSPPPQEDEPGLETDSDSLGDPTDGQPPALGEVQSGCACGVRGAQGTAWAVWLLALGGWGRRRRCAH